MLAPTVPQMTELEEQTTSFIDSNAGAKVGQEVSPLDYELADAQVSAGLGDYLSRPVRVRSFTWAQADAAGATIQNNIPVWFDFMDNPSIKNKLQNFAFIRGNLKLKIITNASPFLYGSLRAVYQPMPNFKSYGVGTGINSLIPISQYPGVWITPAHSEGAEMTCPFVWPRSFLRLGTSADAIGMGFLDFTVYAPLQSANGATSNVSVQVYAWMEDVVLAGPTTGAVLQADEYGVGPISAPASAVAHASRKLSDTPVIGKFAKATEIGASAVSNIAKLFGFTNVPVIEDTRPMRNSPFPQLATAEIGYPNEKLALDPKNELSVDPAIAGIPGDDELSIAKFVAKESYLTSSIWSSAATPDTPLFTSVVTPQLGAVTSPQHFFTPPGLCATMFRNWRGDIIYRFKFITSPFHKGRVRISYDPTASGVQTFADVGPVVFNKIVDLGAETDVEFRIPYQQALPWCYCDTLPSNNFWSTSSSPALSIADTFHNGMISVKVLTALTGPASTASIYMQVFVRGAENMEFANPTTGGYDLSPFAVQSEEYSEAGNSEHHSMGVSSDAEDKRYLVNFGESVRSLRTLMRRQNLLDTVYVPGPTANTVGVFRINQTRFPAHYGYDPAGWNSAKGIVATTTNFNFNFVNSTPWHLISNCFLAQRGSMIWTFNPSRGSFALTSRVARWNYTFPGYNAAYVSSVGSSTNAIELGFWRNSNPTNAGGSVTHTLTTNGHSVVTPSYSPFKFQTTQPSRCTSPAGTSEPQYDGTVFDTLSVEIPYDASLNNIAGVTIERYFGIGTDYTLHFFLCCPVLNFVPAATVTP